MSGSINLSDLVKKPSKPTRSRRRVPSLSDESDSYRNTEIDLTSDSIHKEPVKKEEVVNSPINDRSEQFIKGVSKKEQLKRKDKKLEKIEMKTDKLIAKAKKPAPIKKEKAKKEPTHNYDVYKQDQPPSYQLFIRLRKVPRAILDMIKEKAYWNSDYQEWTSEIHTNEVLSELGINRSNFTTTLSRLGKRGWFKLDTVDKSGFRIVTIDINNYFSEDEVEMKNSTIQ